MARRRGPRQLYRVGRTCQVRRSRRRFLDRSRVARGLGAVHRLRGPPWFRVPQATVGGYGLAGENCLMAIKSETTGGSGSARERLDRTSISFNTEEVTLA